MFTVKKEAVMELLEEFKGHYTSKSFLHFVSGNRRWHIYSNTMFFVCCDLENLILKGNKEYPDIDKLFLSLQQHYAYQCYKSQITKDMDPERPKRELKNSEILQKRIHTYFSRTKHGQ